MLQPSHYRRILIVRPSALGDVCRTVPVLATIKKACPEAAIDWVVQDTLVAAIAAHPALNEAILFPRARFAQGIASGHADVLSGGNFDEDILGLPGQIKRSAESQRFRECERIFEAV